MRIIRISFEKTGEAAYISHLDLQRVMARALRRSGLPVWYSQGFNPHIYMTFALPLPLGQESLVETMDCKTEAEEDDFAHYLPALNAALPRGIRARQIGVPHHTAGSIASAAYRMEYTLPALQVAGCCVAYNQLPAALVTRKTKRSETQFDLKEVLPVLQEDETAPTALHVRLPAGSALNINPELLAGFLAQNLAMPPRLARILRTGVYIKGGEPFV